LLVPGFDRLEYRHHGPVSTHENDRCQVNLSLSVNNTLNRNLSFFEKLDSE